MELFFTLIMVSMIFLAPVCTVLMTVTEASLASSFVVQHKLNLCWPVSSHVLPANETKKEDFVHMYMIKFLWKPLGPPGGVEELPLGASSDCMSAL